MHKYIDDVKQEEKHVPDLLESILRLTFFVKEELGMILFKMNQFGSKISKFKVSIFWTPELRWIPAGGQCQPARW